MAPPNPKSPRNRATPPPKRRAPTVELPFDDDEVLDADDPRPQRVPQYPSSSKRVAAKRANEEVIPTTVYNISQDEELPPTYDPRELSDTGEKPAYLYVEKGPGQGQLIPVRQGALVIGRASVSDLRLQHPSVSRRHAQLTRLGERFYLKDLGSQNATFVNKVRIETEIEIYPGDQVQVGTAQLKLRGAAEKVNTDVKRQIAKAEAVSAKRAAKVEKKKREETERRKVVPASSTNALRVGLACTAIGFGLAILGFVALKVVGQAPQLEGQPQVAAAPTITMDEPVLAIEAEQPTVAVAAAAPAAAQPAEAVEPARAEVAPAPTPRPTVSAAAVARKERPVRERPSREERAPAREAPKVQKASAPSNAEILKMYEDGNVSGAIAAAKDAGDNDLAGKLSDFHQAYNAGLKAERAGDGTGAIKNFQQALAVDEKISGGWGKHGPAISKKLGSLYTLVGQYYLKDDDAKNAELAFKAALKYDPQNAVAKKHLAAAVDSAPAPRPAKQVVRKKRASAIEDAWGDEEEEAAPKKVSTREKRASAIEDAWGD